MNLTDVLGVTSQSARACIHVDEATLLNRRW